MICVTLGYYYTLGHTEMYVRLSYSYTLGQIGCVRLRQMCSLWVVCGAHVYQGCRSGTWVSYEDMCHVKSLVQSRAYEDMCHVEFVAHLGQTLCVRLRNMCNHVGCMWRPCVSR